MFIPNGDNIETLMGHARYLGFNLFCGVRASLAHVFTRAVLNDGFSHDPV